MIVRRKPQNTRSIESLEPLYITPAAFAAWERRMWMDEPGLAGDSSEVIATAKGMPVVVPYREWVRDRLVVAS